MPQLYDDESNCESYVQRRQGGDTIMVPNRHAKAETRRVS